MMNKTFLSKNKLQPTLIAGVIFILLLAVSAGFSKYKKGEWEKDIRAQLLETMTGKKSKLEQALYSRIFYTRGVAAFVALNPGITNEQYKELAKEYIRNDSVINTMALSKNCILSAIYPEKGHEAALGLNLLDHPERKEIVEKTIETRLTFVAGPVELVEGGIAFISYTPIFDKTTPEPKFWGVTDIVIKKYPLLHEAGLKTEENGFQFAMRGYNGNGENGAIFWGNPEIFKQNPVKIKVELPIGNWVMAASPVNGWKHYLDQDQAITNILFFSAFIISVLIWLFSRALLKIRQNEKEMTAIFASLDSLIIEFNSNGDYVKIASENENLLVQPKEKLLGKNIREIFDFKMAAHFQSAIDQCLATKGLIIIEYPLVINGNKNWFMSRISYKNQNSVIFNAYDITEKKRKEKRLEQSQKQLKELNKMKDKFFSVIAHDLRNPVDSQKAVVELLHKEYDHMEDAERKEILHNLENSSKNLFDLLNNLLNWSRSQTGKIKARKKYFNPRNEFSALLSQAQNHAAVKNIQFKNDLAPDATVWGDPNLTSTILLNLVSNAVKFTHPGGMVHIFSEEQAINGSGFYTVSVKDNGIGMNKKKLKSLFRIDHAASVPGTKNEQGTGLGLLLCNEFAELQGGRIEVTSQPDEGSTFLLILPAQGTKKKMKTPADNA